MPPRHTGFSRLTAWATLAIALGVAAVFAATLGAAGVCAAQARVEVPLGCGSERELHDELEQLLGSDASAALPSRLRIGAADTDGLYTLSLQMPGETRVLQDRDCRALWKSAIVMCAVRVRPDLTVPSVPAASERDTPPTAIPATPATNSARARSTPLPWHAGVGLGGGAALGLGPSLAPLVELNGSLELGRVGAALALRVATATETRADAARGARVHALGGRLALLVTPWPIARFQAGVEVHRLSGEGIGSDATLSDTAWMVAPALEAALRPLRFSHVWLELGVGASWAVVRPSFEILDYGIAYRAPRFGGSAVLRLGWQFYLTDRGA